MILLDSVPRRHILITTGGLLVMYAAGPALIAWANSYNSIQAMDVPAAPVAPVMPMKIFPPEEDLGPLPLPIPVFQKDNRPETIPAVRALNESLMVLPRTRPEDFQPFYQPGASADSKSQNTPDIEVLVPPSLFKTIQDILLIAQSSLTNRRYKEQLKLLLPIPGVTNEIPYRGSKVSITKAGVLAQHIQQTARHQPQIADDAHEVEYVKKGRIVTRVVTLEEVKKWATAGSNLAFDVADIIADQGLPLKNTQIATLGSSRAGAASVRYRSDFDVYIIFEGINSQMFRGRTVQILAALNQQYERVNNVTEKAAKAVGMEVADLPDKFGHVVLLLKAGEDIIEFTVDNLFVR